MQSIFFHILWFETFVNPFAVVLLRESRIVWIPQPSCLVSLVFDVRVLG